ncbi:hypothetical protein ACJONO_05460 [Mycoplasmopsis synoviae]
MVCGDDCEAESPWASCVSVASSAGGVTNGGINTVTGFTNLVNGIVIRKVFN